MRRVRELESVRSSRLHELEEELQARRTQALESIQEATRQEQEKVGQPGKASRSNGSARLSNGLFRWPPLLLRAF